MRYYFTAGGGSTLNRGRRAPGQRAAPAAHRGDEGRAVPADRAGRGVAGGAATGPGTGPGKGGTAWKGCFAWRFYR